MAAKRYTIIFYVAIVVAVIATFGVYRVLEATKASSRIATVPVVIAEKDMPEGVIVDRMAVVVAQWPVGTSPPAPTRRSTRWPAASPAWPIYKGEALVPGRLAPEGTGAGLEVKITPGKRAYGIRINDVASLAGMVQPNSRVDIMVVIDDPESRASAWRSCSCRTCACWPSARPRSAPRTAARSAPRWPPSRSRPTRRRASRSRRRRARCSSCFAATATRTASAPTERTRSDVLTD